MTSPSCKPRRPLRSYVLRAGRLTRGQHRALTQLWSAYGLPADAPLDCTAEFANDAPVHLEIGFGDGEALLTMAAAAPHCNFIGVDVHLPGVGRLLRQLPEQNINNVRVFCADAVQVLRAAIAPDSLAAVYLYFPDPWPKKRHHKRRLLQSRFIDLAASRLQPGGYLHFASDWRDYAESALANLDACEALVNCAGDGCFSERPAHRPCTKFERRGRELGHSVWDVVMRKALLTPP